HSPLHRPNTSRESTSLLGGAPPCSPPKPAARGNSPMKWDVNRPRIVVHCVAPRSRALGRSRRSAQTLIADHGAARNFLELAQNFLLKRTGGEMQINIPAQRLRLSG